jgi:ABC-type nitrate/sulfonate/bicarbonate transport system substrate-binding protein
VRQESICPFLVTALLGFLLLDPSLLGTQFEKVKVGLLMINADAGVFVAQEKGYFREQGLAVEITILVLPADRRWPR